MAVGITRRGAMKALAATTAIGALGAPTIARAADPTMVTVVKIIGVPWFNLLDQGLTAAGKDLQHHDLDDRSRPCRSGPAGR